MHVNPKLCVLDMLQKVIISSKVGEIHVLSFAIYRDLLTCLVRQKHCIFDVGSLGNLTVN